MGRVSDVLAELLCNRGAIGAQSLNQINGPFHGFCRRKHMIASYRAWLSLVLTVLVAPLALADIEFSGDPIPLADAKGKAGPIRVTLPERSPLSVPKEIAKRMHLPKDAPLDDYDWKAEVYD